MPAPDRLEGAAAYARARAGTVSFAVVDTAGRVHGLDARRPFASARVVKAMILVAHLNGVERRAAALSPSERARLDDMIRASANASGTGLARVVGQDGLNEVARRGGMRDTRPQVARWGATQTTAADQARLFSRIDALVPPRQREYARRLLSSIVPEHRWGTPQVAPPHSSVLFKGGWLPGGGGRWTIHQAAKVERGERSLVLAVLTKDNPGRAYGEETLRAIAERLLR